MPEVDRNDLEDAMRMLDESGSAARGWVSRDTGKVHLRNDELEDLGEPLPADIDDGEQYIDVPPLRTFDLGPGLVARFTREHLPADHERVKAFFRSQGAYRRFSALLAERGNTATWHSYRDDAIRNALQEWCEENGLRLGA